MGAAKGWRQINFQVPEKTYNQIEAECKKMGILKGEFCTRLIVSFFLHRELGLEREMCYFTTGVVPIPPDEKKE